MKLTKTQLAYLRSAAESPIGRTAVYAKTLEAMVKAGVVIHREFGIVEIADAGRQALATSKGGER